MNDKKLSFIANLTKREISEKYAGSVLGSLWAVIWPLVHLSIYIVIFGKFMGGQLAVNDHLYAYGIYLTVGLMPWICFSNTINRSCMVFIDKKNIISKIHISLPSLLIFINLSEVITFLISAGLFVAFLIITNYEWHPRLILFPCIFYLQQIIAFGLGLISATIVVFFKDLKEIVGIILQLWFWFTPIVYIINILPKSVAHVLKFNPAFIITESYHRMFIFDDYPAFDSLLILAVIAHIILFIAYGLFKYLEKDIRDFL